MKMMEEIAIMIAFKNIKERLKHGWKSVCGNVIIKILLMFRKQLLVRINVRKNMDFDTASLKFM